MIEASCQTPLAKATTDLMGVWALAVSQTAIQTLNFWTRVFRSSLLFPALAVRTGAARTMPRGDPGMAGSQTFEASKRPEQLGTHTEPGFSSYRSSGGHAVAQIIVPQTN